ncbi:MAG: hypothetical protein QNJ90_01095 [Planctomycetota bacterium]|nr:hypothetical protein [Planctomycetota bacterium]
MSAWRIFNIVLLIALVYLGAAWALSWPPFGGDAAGGEVEPIDVGTLETGAGKGKGRPGMIPTAPVPAAAVSTTQIANTVSKASLWLIQHQRRDGSWGEMRVKGAYGPFHIDRPGFHQAGPTAIALYALLESGLALRHPVVRRGFAYLEKHHVWPATSPETAMVLMAITATRSSETGERLSPGYRKWAMDLVDHLVKKRTAKGWRYNYQGRYEPPQIGGREDVISTHLAALALLSAKRVGIEAEKSVWMDILRFTLAQQEPITRDDAEGPEPRGFAYVLGHDITDNGKATGGTTACGVANVLMARYVLTERGTKPAALQNEDPILGRKVEAGLAAADAWLVKHWHPSETPGKAPGSKVLHHHWLWALETAMDLNPVQPGRLGPYSWYPEIASGLIGRQSDDGAWHNPGMWEPANVIDTSLAILFLERASRNLLQPR